MTDDGNGDRRPDVVRATRQGLVLPDVPSGPVDMLFDGQRVLAASPKEFRRGPDGASYTWPLSLRGHLTGVTTLTVREHASGDVLIEAEITFDQSSARTAVTDRHGHPLAVDKGGLLGPMFDTADQTSIRALLGTAQRLLQDIEAFGAVAFIGYGTLLGAVRNGKLIGHDNDIDLNYFSTLRDPAAIVLESLAMARFLRGRGWEVDRPRASFIRVRVPEASAGSRWMDVFMAFHDGDYLYVDSFVRAKVPADAVAPTSTIVLEGVEMAAPRLPEQVLAATYGPDFLVPDPSFKHHRTQFQIRTTLAWFGNFRLYRRQWRDWFLHAHPDPGPVSSLAREVGATVQPGGVVVDVGCGHGQDALWLARRGVRVIATDHVREPLKQMRAAASAEGLALECWELGFYYPRLCIVRGALVAALPEPAKTVMVARDVVDVLDSAARENFWQFLRTALLAGGLAVVTVRDDLPATGTDEPGAQDVSATELRIEAERAGARVRSTSRADDRTVLELTWA